MGPKALLSEVSADAPGKYLIFRLWFGFCLVLLRVHAAAIQTAGPGAGLEGRMTILQGQAPVESQRKTSAAGSMLLILRGMKEHQTAVRV